ncbi:MAG TPA: helix-turn-helix domain-containing protein [Mariprofundaceae bacterium]|nr:helix-turn-helix domain-containing protein [Mariprofundaceae bacterium]
MKKKITSDPRSSCPINVTLETLGDAWSLLIVRDLMFFGRKSFNEFLNAGEKIASNILAERLQRLENAGIVTKQRDPDDARKYLYRLTEKGIDLAPLLTDMMLWAARYEEVTMPPEALREMQTNRAKFLANVRNQWELGLGNS